MSAISAIIVFGYFILFVGGILMLVQMFKTNVLWGAGAILIPLVQVMLADMLKMSVFSGSGLILLPIVPVYWLVKNWEHGRDSFLFSMLGLLLVFVGTILRVYVH